MRQLLTLYTEGRFWVGYVDLLPNERLSDLINNTFAERTEKYNRFLQIDDVTITKVDNTLDNRMKTAYVNKAYILIIIPQQDALSGGFDSNKTSDNSLHIQKTPVYTNLVLPGYDIRGYIHCSREQTPCSLFEEQLGFIPLTRFIPMTDVKIKVLDSLASWTYPFAAVSREQVLSFEVKTPDSQY